MSRRKKKRAPDRLVQRDKDYKDRKVRYKGGREYIDPVPFQPAVRMGMEKSLNERIRDMVRSERLAQELDSAGAETFEEADDFDVGDDFDPESPYEVQFDPPEPLVDNSEKLSGMFEKWLTRQLNEDKKEGLPKKEPSEIVGPNDVQTPAQKK